MPHLHLHVMDGTYIHKAFPLPVVLHLEDGFFDHHGGDILSDMQVVKDGEYPLQSSDGYKFRELHRQEALNR